MGMNIMTVIKLVHYECKKLFSFTFIRLILALMLALNIVMSLSYIKPLHEFNKNQGIETVYELYRSDPDLFRAQYDVILDDWYHGTNDTPLSNYTDGKAFDRTLFFMTECFADADSDYQRKINTLIVQTKIAMKPFAPDSYSYRYHSAIIEKYEALKETVEIKNEPVYGWKEYFAYSAEVVFVLLAVLACAVVIGLNDHTTGFVSIRFASPRGGRSTVTAKLIAVALVSFVIAVVFALSSLLVIGAVYGFSDAGNAIQAVFDKVDVNFGDRNGGGEKFDLMVFCPLALSIAEFLVVFFLQKAMAAVICGIFIFTASIFCRRYWLSGAIGGIFIFLQHRMHTLETVSLDQWKYLNVFSIFSPKEFLLRFRSVNLFGCSVDLICVFYAVFVLILALSFFICTVFYQQGGTIRSAAKKTALGKRRSAFAQYPPRKTTAKKYGASFSMIRYEFFKSKAVFLLLAVLIIGKCMVSSHVYEWKDTAYNAVYRRYIGEIGGEYSAEKAKYVNDEYELQWQILIQSKEMEEQFSDGLITSDEYNEYLQQCAAAQIKTQVLEELKLQSSHLERLYAEKGVRGSYIFPVGFEKYINQDTDWLLMIFICVLCCNTFIVEFGKTSSRGAVISLIQSTPRGRASLYRTKLLLVCMTVTAVYGMFYVIDYANLSSNWHLPNMGELLVSYSPFAETPTSLTFGGYFALTAFSGFLGALLISLICVSVSQMLKEPVFVYAICATFLVVPHFAQSVGVETCGYFNLTNLVNTNALFAMSNRLQWMGAFGWFGIFFISSMLLTGALVWISAKQIQKGLKG